MSENRNGLIIGVLAILLVVIFMIPITNMLIDPDTPDPLETPIFELNNHSLKQVFESTTPALTNLLTNGDFSDGTTSWELLGTGNALLVVGGVLQVTRTTGVLVFRQTTNNLLNGNVYYVRIGTIQTDMTEFYMYRSGTANFIRLDNNNWRGGFLATGDGRTSFGREVYQDGSYVNIDNINLFDLTELYGVTATSGTAYDNAVAEIEWILSKNDGYIQSVGNPFKIVDLTVEQMEYWFSLYQYYKSL